MDTIIRLEKAIEANQRINFNYKGKYRRNALPTKMINNHIVYVKFNSEGKEYKFMVSGIENLKIQNYKSDEKKKIESLIHNKTRGYFESLCLNKINTIVDNPEEYKNSEYEISVLERTIEKMNGRD